MSASAVSPLAKAPNASSRLAQDSMIRARLRRGVGFMAWGAVYHVSRAGWLMPCWHCDSGTRMVRPLEMNALIGAASQRIRGARAATSFIGALLLVAAWGAGCHSDAPQHSSPAAGASVGGAAGGDAGSDSAGGGLPTGGNAGAGGTINAMWTTDAGKYSLSLDSTYLGLDPVAESAELGVATDRRWQHQRDQYVALQRGPRGRDAHPHERGECHRSDGLGDQEVLGGPREARHRHRIHDDERRDGASHRRALGDHPRCGCGH